MQTTSTASTQLSPFYEVSRNLLKIGAISIESFLSSSSNVFNTSLIPYASNTFKLYVSPPPSDISEQETGKPSDIKTVYTKTRPVERLEATCKSAHGSLDPLKFEILEDSKSPQGKQCILAISRPEGSAWSYTTQLMHSKEIEAKADAASIALEMGALDFVMHGDTVSTPEAENELVFTPPLDLPKSTADDKAQKTASFPLGDTNLVEQIENACTQWRIMPQWFNLIETKTVAKSHGSALKLEVSPNSFRVYSARALFNSQTEAKEACARAAIEEGVLEFISTGTTESTPRIDNTNESTSSNQKQSSLTMPLSLQSFYDSLPKPFPEDFGDKKAAEIIAPAWLNTAIQSARGSKISAHFLWIADGSLGLHGCLLRLEHPAETKSYLVEPKFPKRADAKAAVCLQAISQGVGGYLRSAGTAVENKITPGMRQFANKQAFPVIASECHKVKPGSSPLYVFSREKDAHGCTLKVDVSLTGLLDTQYTVPSEYCSKGDAKVAVAILAVDAGLLELLRFRGDPPPLGYVPLSSSQIDETIVDIWSEGGKKKKKKTSPKSLNPKGDVSSTPEHADAARYSFPLPNRPGNSNNKAARKKLHASESLWPGAKRWLPGHPIAHQASGSRNVSHSEAQGAHHTDGALSQPYPAPSVQRYPHEQSGGGLGYGGQGMACRAPPHPPSGPLHGPPPSQPPFGVAWKSEGARGYHDSELVPSYTAGTRSTPYSSHYGAAPVSSSLEQRSTFTPVQQHRYTPYPPSNSAFNYHAAPSRNITTASRSVAGPPPKSYSGLKRRASAELDVEPSAVKARSRKMHKHNKAVPSTNQSTYQSRPAQCDESPQDVITETVTDTLSRIRDQAVSDPKVNVSKLHVNGLVGYCESESLPQPEFHDKLIGNVSHKVWVTLGNEKFELPTVFLNLDEGRERVAKLVLNRLRGRAKKGKEKELVS